MSSCSCAVGYIRSRGPSAGPVLPGLLWSATGRCFHVGRPAIEALRRIPGVLSLFHCRQTPANTNKHKIR